MVVKFKIAEIKFKFRQKKLYFIYVSVNYDWIISGESVDVREFNQSRINAKVLFDLCESTNVVRKISDLSLSIELF